METDRITPESENNQVRTIRGYYRLHASIYQATRWLFLFGRRRLILVLKLPAFSDKTVVEVGCGTGHNLATLGSLYSKLKLIGIDISPDMLKVAAKKLRSHSSRVQFLEKPYGSGDWKLPAKPEVVLFSYCLTMINPGWEDSLQRAYDDLEEGGQIAVVDFHGSHFGIFRRWMDFNHVRVDKHLLPFLATRFTTSHVEIRQAYGGLWSYFLFVGKK
ncbi:MAG: class I SAM-dependent methyltransferase [Saprospiraceae bacterium]